MVRRSWAFTPLLASLFHNARAAVPTWPSAIDELEDIMFLNTGYRARNFAGPVTPCGASPGNGRLTGAEWLRTAFHDMAPGNVYLGSGGMDASIMFELGGDNPGPGFPATLQAFVPFLTTKSSYADLIALGVYASVRACSGPIIPIKAGRIDATESGSSGVPQPQNSIGTFQNQFDRMGFSSTEMIQFVACGHTMGTVKALNFPDIVPPGSAPPYDAVQFDGTPAFDEQIAAQYVAGTTKDPLVSGACTASTRCSDLKVFSSDRNATIRNMANPATFQTKCKAMFQKMIDVVPSGVTLTDPITPYDVKPSGLQLTLLDGANRLSFTGEIRIRTTVRAASKIASVSLVYSGGTITTASKGTANGFDDSFTFYGFSAQIPASTSITSFTVTVGLVGGGTEKHDNNGAGFPVQDKIIFQSPQSCLNGNSLTVVAAVKNTESASAVSLTVTTKVAQDYAPVPALASSTVSMTKQSTIGLYSLYSASYTLSSTDSNNRFDVSLGSGPGVPIDGFKKTSDLGTTCKPFGSEDSTSSTTGTTATTGTTGTSSATGTTLSTMTTSGGTSTSSTSAPSSTAYSYDGCYTDPGNPRALRGANTASNDMTIDKCFIFCSSFQYFGLEYGRECYCGNSRDSSSVAAPDSECSSKCAGNPLQKCGAGKRLSTYKNLQYSPIVPPKIPGYTYSGCYNEVSGRALAGSNTASDTMTVENCASFCNGATYFGVEYGRECYCSSTLKAGSTKQPESDCSFPCKGNANQFCGAGSRLNVYIKGSSASSAAGSAPSSPA